jgi:hypothetical protein
MELLDTIKLQEKKINEREFRGLALFFIKFVYVFFIGALLVFARPVLGLEVFQFKIGELAILFGFLLSIITLIMPKRVYLNFFEDSLFFYTQKLITLSFIVLALISKSDFLSSYTYKSSSYIWSISFIYLGLLYLCNFRVEKYNPLFGLSIVPFVAFFISTGNYPNFIMKFFKENSDKFQFLKPSDIFLGYIVSNFVNRFIFKTEKNRLLFLIISTSLLAPLLLVGSRGSFLGLSLFFCLEIFSSRKYIISHFRQSIMFIFVGIVVLILSVTRIDFENGNNLNFAEDLAENASPAGLVESLRDFENEKDTVRVFFTFYWHYGRLTSSDATTNWRLDIWQDVLHDMIDEKKIISGYGYKQVLPQMLDPEAPGRLGRDGLNENIHNYAMNIFARGGILQLALFIILHSSYFIYWKKINKNNQILNFILPCMFVSFLDVTMEGVHFPLIYYSFIYYFLLMSIKVNKI